MGLGMFLVLIGIVLLTGFLYRRRTIRNAEASETVPLTAASITTIEAAFLRAGCDGVAEFRAAAARCGAQLDDLDVTSLEEALALRRFAFDAGTRTKMRNARIAGHLIVVPAALASTIHSAARGGWSREPLAALIEFAILGGGAAIAVTAVTRIGPSTNLGRAALAMRRAAYPLWLLRDADPPATVAHYGGALRRRTKDASGVGDGGDGEYIWVDAGSGTHGHATDSGGHSSHSCASSCGSGGCGGH